MSIEEYERVNASVQILRRVGGMGGAVSAVEWGSIAPKSTAQPGS